MSDVTKVTQEAQKEAIVHSISGGSSVTDACESAGITTRTYYRWLTSDGEFAASIAAAKVAKIETVRDVAFECALKAKEDPRFQTALIAWMNNEGDWRNPTRHEIENVKQLTDTELESAITDLLRKTEVTKAP